MQMNFDRLNGKKILISQTRSCSGCNEDQKGTLLGLSLKRIGDTAEIICTKPVYGMLVKVAHLIDIKVK